MFGSGTLDVVIGVIFVYLLVSLAVTSLNELVAAILKSRGKYLWQGIQNLFEEAKDWKDADKAEAKRVADASTLARVKDAVAAVQSSAGEVQQARAKREAAQGHVENTQKIYDTVMKALEAGGADTAALTEKAGAAAAAKAAAVKDLNDAVASQAAAVAKHDALLSSQATDDGLRLAKLTVAATQARGVADALKKVANADPSNEVKKEAMEAAMDAANRADATAGRVNSDHPQFQGGSWSERLYNHSLIQALYQNPKSRTKWLSRIPVQNKRPSYIPAQTFAVALMDLVLPSGAAARANTFADIRAAIDKIPYDAPNRNIKQALLSLVREAENTTDTASSALKKVQDQVEVWFNDAMDRVGGWYKRQTQYVVCFLTAILVLVLNLDTITIAHALNRDSALRATVVGMAQQATQPGPNQITVNYPGNPPSTQPTTPDVQKATAEFQARLQKIQLLGIPVGWKFGTPPSGDADDGRYFDVCGGIVAGTGKVLLKIAGLLLTTMAAALGAPFWFDVLNKVVTVRGSGKAPEEQPKSPKEVPTPREPKAGATPGPAGSPLRT